ncbi:MAG: hypothetical protein XXXJIFNMEKO3_02252 [Candidatus Erwinia impunctatus]|nr:hypothetical protein XXXJIFNMEKO_02252 [Culicoides impunctatus]
MASFKELFEIGQSYQDFVRGGVASEVLAINTIEKRISAEGSISRQTRQRLAAIEGHYHLLVAGEMWCPDCHVNIPAFYAMCQMQPKLTMAIISKGRAEDDLQQRLTLDKVLVPVVAVLDSEYRLIGKYVERPNVVVQQGTAEVLADYKAGKYIEESISDVINIIYAAESR